MHEEKRWLQITIMNKTKIGSTGWILIRDYSGQDLFISIFSTYSIFYLIVIFQTPHSEIDKYPNCNWSMSPPHWKCVITDWNYEFIYVKYITQMSIGSLYYFNSASIITICPRWFSSYPPSSFFEAVPSRFLQFASPGCWFAISDRYSLS